MTSRAVSHYKRWNMGALLVSILALLGPADDGERVLLVLPLHGRGGISQDSADLCTQVLIAELRKVRGYKIVSASSVNDALSIEQQRQLMDCDSESCAAELAGALSAQEFIAGNIGRVGESSMVMNLNLVDARSATTLSAVVRTWDSGDEGDALHLIPGMVRELMSRKPGSGITRVAPTVDPAPRRAQRTVTPPERSGDEERREKREKKARKAEASTEEIDDAPVARKRREPSPPAAWRTPVSRVLLGIGAAGCACAAANGAVCIGGPTLALSMFPTLMVFDRTLAGRGYGPWLSIIFVAGMAVAPAGALLLLVGTPLSLINLVTAWLVSP